MNFKFLNLQKEGFETHSRILGLDIVRSIAILLVLCGHSVSLLPKGLQNYYWRIAPDVDGVSIFFVLSGFLIGGILLKTIEKSSFTIKDLLNFWIRRWFRTLPNYFLVLLCLSFYEIVRHQRHMDYLLNYFIFFQNFAFPHPSFFPEAWSLSIEEWFYIFFPLTSFIFYKLLKNKNRSVLFCAFFFLFIPFFIRLFCYVQGIGVDNVDANYRKVLVFRLDSLMYGIIGAYIYRFKNKYWSKYKKPLLAFSLAIVFCHSLFHNKASDLYKAVFCFNIESLAAALMLPFFSELKSIKSDLFTFLFTAISITSYSMYLLNYTPIMHYAIPMTLSVVGLKHNKWEYLFILKFFMYWIYLIVGSFILYKYFERPMMEKRRKVVI